MNHIAIKSYDSEMCLFHILIIFFQFIATYKISNGECYFLTLVKMFASARIFCQTFWAFLNLWFKY